MSRTQTHFGVIIFFVLVTGALNACARMPIPTIVPTKPPPTATPIPPTATPTPVTPTPVPPTATPVPPTPTPAPFIFSSAVFSDGGMLPIKFTCDAENVSPPLTWTGVPYNAQSLAVMLDDPDAVVTTFTHWILFDIPATTNGLPENVKGIGKGGLNSAKRITYVGPCHPTGSHRFVFQLFALNVPTLGLNEGASKTEIDKALNAHLIAKQVITTRYGK